MKTSISEETYRDILEPSYEDFLRSKVIIAPERGSLIAAVDQMKNFFTDSLIRAKPRARAMVYLLLYSGFRISDAVKLERKRVDMKNGKLLVRMMKTGHPLYIRLHADAINALKKLPADSPYFFWSGRGKLSSAIGSARRTIECLTRIANIEGHPQRFRDTFAVELLKNGEHIRTVQLLLGHTSVTTTERHYAPFVAAFQTRLDQATKKLRFGSRAQSRRATSRTREFSG
jgi:integrase